ncbi:MAG TPA: hypothetical protein VNX47_05840 [Nevskia sp.]|jgi:hypothetical protein|nr:hypothetical protein [Nevskia sp.]
MDGALGWVKEFHVAVSDGTGLPVFMLMVAAVVLFFALRSAKAARVSQEARMKKCEDDHRDSRIKVQDQDNQIAELRQRGESARRTVVMMATVLHMKGIEIPKDLWDIIMHDDAEIPHFELSAATPAPPS